MLAARLPLLLAITAAAETQWPEESWLLQLGIERRNETNASLGGQSEGAANLCIGGRLAPEFLLLGAQKAGSTVLWHELRKNTDIHHSRDEQGRYVKEVHFFDREDILPFSLDVQRAWLRHYPKCSKQTRAVAIDSTPKYLRMPQSPARIASYYGREKSKLTFTILLREPMQRMQSAYYWRDGGPRHAPGHLSQRNLSLIYPPTFQAYVTDVLSAPTKKKLLRRLHREDMPFIGSLYVEQLQRYFSYFEPSQFIVAPFRFAVSNASRPLTLAQTIFAKLGIAQPSRGFTNLVPHHVAPQHYPPLQEDLDDASFAGLSALVKLHAGARKIARVLRNHRGAHLYGYTGSRDDEAAIAAWLSANW